VRGPSEERASSPACPATPRCSAVAPTSPSGCGPRPRAFRGRRVGCRDSRRRPRRSRSAGGARHLFSVTDRRSPRPASACDEGNRRARGPCAGDARSGPQPVSQVDRSDHRPRREQPAGHVSSWQSGAIVPLRHRTPRRSHRRTCPCPLSAQSRRSCRRHVGPAWSKNSRIAPVTSPICSDVSSGYIGSESDRRASRSVSGNAPAPRPRSL
jgi:hypothetical protein